VCDDSRPILGPGRVRHLERGPEAPDRPVRLSKTDVILQIMYLVADYRM
jgi:hypothetical protein